MTDPKDLSDSDLLAAYQRTTGEPGDADADTDQVAHAGQRQ